MKNSILTHINEIPIRRNFVENLPYNPNLKLLLKDKRKARLLSEVLFWKQVRAREFHQIDFDRQKIIGNYIGDFYIKSLGVVIEIDGSSHNDKEDYDNKRQLFLESLDLVVYRISDYRIKNDLINVMKELEDFIIEKFS